MKNLAIFTFLILLFATCQKEEIMPLVTDSPDGITRLYVKVTFYDDDSGHCNDNYNVVSVNNARVSLYDKDHEASDEKNLMMEGQTDYAGLVKFENLPAGKYLVEVNSGYGRIDKAVLVEAGKITRIETRY